MNKLKKTITTFFVVIGVLFLILFYFYLNSDNDAEEGIIFFYSYTCPHCKTVEDFMDETQVRQIINISEKEVSTNLANQQLFIKLAKECGVSQDSLGVPLLYHDGECLFGDVDIIEFLESEMNRAESS